MLARSAPESALRRSLLRRVALIGLSALAAGCERKLPLVPTPLAVAKPKPMAPTPLQSVAAPTSPAVTMGVTFGRSVILEGVTVERETVRSGDFLRLWLHWQATGGATDDLRSIGRLVTAGGRVLASEDDQIGGRRSHLTRWQPGERRVDEMRMRIAPSVAEGEYGLLIGVLRPDNQTTVPLTTRPPAASDQEYEDAVLAGTIIVVSA